MMSFVILEVFSMDDDLIVFAGTTAETAIVTKCDAQLFVGEEAPILIELEGEFMLTPSSKDLRAVSTRTKMPYSVGQLNKSDCHLLVGRERLRSKP